MLPTTSKQSDKKRTLIMRDIASELARKNQGKDTTVRTPGGFVPIAGPSDPTRKTLISR